MKNIEYGVDFLIPKNRLTPIYCRDYPSAVRALKRAISRVLEFDYSLDARIVVVEEIREEGRSKRTIQRSLRRVKVIREHM